MLNAKWLGSYSQHWDRCTFVLSTEERGWLNDLFFVDGIDAGRLNPRISWETCLSWRERKVGNDSTCRDLQWQGQRIREFYSWKKRGHDFCAISFAVASYAIKPALTNSGPTTLGFPRFDPRKYTKLHLNALFSVQFTRLVPNFIVIFLPMENGSPLSILSIFFFRKKKRFKRLFFLSSRSLLTMYDTFFDIKWRRIVIFLGES